MSYVELKYLKAECWLPGVWEGPGFYLQGWGKCSKIRKLQGCECLKCHWMIHFNTVACVHAKSLQSCPTLCDPVACSPPGSSVHGILQARILEWVVMPSSRGSSWPRDGTRVSCSSCIAGGFFLFFLLYLNNFLLDIVDLQCWVSFRCAVRWIGYTYTYIHSFSDSFPISVITEYWVEFPVWYSRFLLVTGLWGRTESDMTDAI